MEWELYRWNKLHSNNGVALAWFGDDCFEWISVPLPTASILLWISAVADGSNTPFRIANSSGNTEIKCDNFECHVPFSECQNVTDRTTDEKFDQRNILSMFELKNIHLYGWLNEASNYDCFFFLLLLRIDSPQTRYSYSVSHCICVRLCDHHRMYSLLSIFVCTLTDAINNVPDIRNHSVRHSWLITDSIYLLIIWFVENSPSTKWNCSIQAKEIQDINFVLRMALTFSLSLNLHFGPVK